MDEEEIDIKLLQSSFYPCADDLSDLMIMQRSNGSTIWLLVEKPGIQKEDWTVCKEIIEKESALHAYRKSPGFVKNNEKEPSFCKETTSASNEGLSNTIKKT